MVADCCAIESVCGLATWFWVVPFSTGNIAQLKSRGPCRIMPCAAKFPCTVIAHLPPKNAGSTPLPERPVAAASTLLST